MSEVTKKNNFPRAFELDFLRGLSIIMMILHHFIYDLRYVFELDVFAFQDSYIFIYWIRAFFVFIFLFVSGICCSFSRNNLKRSIKMGLVALLFSVVFYIVSKITDSEMFIIFNVLHLLALGTLLYSILSYFENKYSFKSGNIVLIFIGIVFLWLSYPLSYLDSYNIPALIPFHEKFAFNIGMADYMPLVPWFGLFIFGALFGRLYYSDKKSIFPSCPKGIRIISIPFEFVGRYALYFYLFHQVVVLGILYLLKFVGVLK